MLMENKLKMYVDASSDISTTLGRKSHDGLKCLVHW